MVSCCYVKILREFQGIKTLRIFFFRQETILKQFSIFAAILIHKKVAFSRFYIINHLIWLNCVLCVTFGKSTFVKFLLIRVIIYIKLDKWKGCRRCFGGGGWVDEFSMLKCSRLKKPIQLNAENIIKNKYFCMLVKRKSFHSNCIVWRGHLF